MARKASTKREQPEGERRSDYGTFKKTDKDWSGWELVGSMRWVRFDTLGELWDPEHKPANVLPYQNSTTGQEEKRGRGGSRKGFPWPKDHLHRMMAVARIVYRWKEHGFAKLKQPWDGQPQWVSLTEAGYAERRLPWHEIDWPEDDKDLRHDDDYSISHIHRINQMRMRLLGGAANAPSHEWISERAIEADFPLKEAGMSLPHLPDGVMHLQEDGKWDIEIEEDGIIETVDTVEMKSGQQVAIEVELSRKSYPRLQWKVLPSLLEKYDFVWYFADEDARKAVYKARDEHVPNEEDQRRIRIMKLDDYLS
jgi:hypothetical protein